MKGAKNTICKRETMTTSVEADSGRSDRSYSFPQYSKMCSK